MSRDASVYQEFRSSHSHGSERALSGAAERYVKACTHPKVKGGARDLAEAIARRILEGETTTPAILIDDLALEARIHRRTVFSRLEVLIDIGVVQVIDGGRGSRYSRYQLLGLDGTPPIADAPLPLVGATPVRRLRPPPTAPARTPGLFTDAPTPAAGEETAIKRSADRSLLWKKKWRSITSFGKEVITSLQKKWRSITSRSAGEETAIKRSADRSLLWKKKWRSITSRQKEVAIDHFFEFPSSRSVRTYEVVVGEDARARDADDEFLDWFERTYPTEHQGAACRVDRASDGPRVRELLARPGTDGAHLQAMSLALWSITTDGVWKSDRWWIAERVKVRNVFVLHRKADFLDREVRQRQTAAAAAADIDATRRDVEQRLGPDWRKSG